MSEKLSGGLVDNVLSLLLSLFLIVSVFINFLKLVTRSEKNIPSLYQWIKLNVMNNTPDAIAMFQIFKFTESAQRCTDVLRKHSQYT